MHKRTYFQFIVIYMAYETCRGFQEKAKLHHIHVIRKCAPVGVEAAAAVERECK